MFGDRWDRIAAKEGVYTYTFNTKDKDEEKMMMIACGKKATNRVGVEWDFSSVANTLTFKTASKLTLGEIKKKFEAITKC